MESPKPPEVETREVEYEADGVKMKGLIAWDKNKEGKRPGVLVVHEWWGHNQYVRNRAEELARNGYVAMAIDMYGDGKKAEHPDDAGKFAGMVMQNMPGAKKRFMAAKAVLESDPHFEEGEMAAIGYCFGGSVCLSMAVMGVDLQGVAAFHSGVKLPVQPEEGKTIEAKMLVMNGAEDPMITEEDEDNFKTMVEGAGAQLDYITLDGAKHAYTNPEATAIGEKFNLPLAYNQEADAQATDRLYNFLSEIFE